MLDLEFIKQQYAREGLTTQIYEIVKRAAAAVVWARRIPSWRALDGQWDSDAIIALTDDILMETLTTAKLAYLFDICTNMAELEFELEKLIGDYLRRTASRGALGNLQEQIIRILESAPEFICMSTKGKQKDWVWGLSKWSDYPPSHGDRERVSDVLPLLRAFKKPHYKPDARKRPPALRFEDLRLFLRELFDKTNTPWITKDLIDLIADNLCIADKSPIPLEDIDKESSHSFTTATKLDPAELMEIKNVAHSFYKTCSNNEREMLKALASGVKSLEQVGQVVGVSKATASRHLKELTQRLTQCSDDMAFVEAVWEELMSVAINF